MNFFSFSYNFFSFFNIFNFFYVTTINPLFSFFYNFFSFFKQRVDFNFFTSVAANSNYLNFIFCIFFFSPLEQFEVSSNSNRIDISGDFFSDIEVKYSFFFDLFGLSSITEVMFYFIFFIVIFFFFYIKNTKFYPYSWIQLFVESYVVAIRNFVIQNTGLGNQPMFILFIAITTSLIIFNISGMIPFAFAVTSHFITTFFYSFSLFFGINYIAIIRHKEKFFNIFLPQGTPIFLLPLLVALEFVSYFSRLFSLGIRLFANIMAGHALLSIFTSFAFKAIVSGGFPMMVSCIGIAILFAVIFMEVAIAFLQVFVFLTLTALYVVDVHSVNH